MIRVDDKKGGFIKPSRAEKFILLVGEHEEKIFEKRSALLKWKLRQLCSQAMLNNTKEIKEKVKYNLRRKADLFKDGSFGVDKVRLGSPGYKERYYKEKFYAESPGVIESIRKRLMLTKENEIDVDGKRFSWQGVCKLPFIEEKCLLLESAKLEKDLGVEERERNSEKRDQLLVRRTHKLGAHILSLSTDQKLVKTATSLSSEIGGVLWLQHEHKEMDKEEAHKGNYEEETVLSVLYEPPNCGPFVPRLLDGVECPEKTIRDDDIEETPLWHEYQGTKPPNKYMNIQQNFARVSIGGNSAAKSSEDKSAGSRWGVGRGGRTSSTNYGSPIPMTSRRESFGFTTSYDQRGVHRSAGSGWGAGRGRTNCNSYASSPSYASNNFRRTTDLKEWRVVHSSHDARNISTESRTSEWSSGGVQQGNTSFLPPRNNAWRPSFRPDGGYGRGTRTSNDFRLRENNSSFAGNHSRQFNGRG